MEDYSFVYHFTFSKPSLKRKALKCRDSLMYPSSWTWLHLCIINTIKNKYSIIFLKICIKCWTLIGSRPALVNIANPLSCSHVFRSMTWQHRSCARPPTSQREASRIASPWWWEATALSMRRSGWPRLTAPRACSSSARTDWWPCFWLYLKAVALIHSASS